MLIDFIMISRVYTIESMKENIGTIIFDSFLLIILASVLMFCF